jgi:hypothetical protein
LKNSKAKVKKAGFKMERRYSQSEDKVSVQLHGEEIEVPYEGKPIEVLLGSHVLKIGKPVDLGIEQDPQPDVFNIIDLATLSETNGAMGRKRLEDGKVIIIGSGATHDFKFYLDVSPIHMGIKVNGNLLTIKDFHSSGNKTTTVRF